MEETVQINHNPVSMQQELETSNSEKEELRNKLAELTKEMNQFTYIVSHDLQAPLRMVTGFLELLEKKYGNKLDASAKQYIDYAVKGATKMKNLVFDLLEYSRLSSAVKEYEEVDLNIIFKEVKEKLQPVFEEAKAVITTDHLPVVIADRKQIFLLLEHLLGNALKFRSLEPPLVAITVKKENNFWTIAVKDNGIGVEVAFAEKIFIIFRRLHNDDAKYGGTGTGLAMCKKIIELHGGTIWVEPAVENGSVFYFNLPVKSQ